MSLLLRVSLVPERARYGLFRRDDFSPPITNWYQSERHRRRGSVEVVAVVDVNGGNPRVERESHVLCTGAREQFKVIVVSLSFGADTPVSCPFPLSGV